MGKAPLRHEFLYLLVGLHLPDRVALTCVKGALGCRKRALCGALAASLLASDRSASVPNLPWLLDCSLITVEVGAFFVIFHGLERQAQLAIAGLEHLRCQFHAGRKQLARCPSRCFVAKLHIWDQTAADATARVPST